MHRLWQFRLCPHSRSVRLALHELGVAVACVDERPWDWRAELLALNPAGELPILRIEHGPLLAGWYAIIEYLAEAPRVPGSGGRQLRLLPGGREDRAEVRRLADWFLGKLHREVTREMLLDKVYPLLRRHGAGVSGPGLAGLGAPDAEVLRQVRANLRYHLSYIAFLAYQRNWLAGDEASFADLAAAAQLSVLDYLGEVPWDEHPAMKEWYGRVKSRPAVREMLGDWVPGLPAPPAHYANLDF